MWNDYAVKGGTFRENLNGKAGAKLLPSTHVGSQYRYDILKEKYGDENGDIVIDKTIKQNGHNVEDTPKQNGIHVKEIPTR